jgi:hypothetical protein
MSDYFTYTPLTANTVARAADVNARFQGVAAGFDLLPPPQYITEDRLTYATDTGLANAYIANPTIPITAYNTGLHIVVQAINANTGASTVNVSGLGVKQIVRADGTPLQAGDIAAGQVLDMTYDGAAFRLAMAFADISPAGVAAKIALAGNIVVNGNLDADTITCNGVTLDALTTFGVSLIESANATAARGLLGLGTMATESAASYALLASPTFTGTPLAPTAAPGTNTTQLATTAFVTAAVTAAGSVSDTAYGVGWNGVTTVAPSKNAVYDQIETLSAATTASLATKSNLAGGNAFTGAQSFAGAVALDGGATVPDDAYGAGWNGSLGVATKNAIYDKIETVIAGGGVADGDKGDITVASGVWTLDNGVVSLGKMSNLAANSFIGNNTGGAATPIALTVAQAKTLLALENVSNLSPANLPISTATQTALDLKAPLASPALTGVPTAPTAADGTNSTQIASTGFVQSVISFKANLASPTFTGTPAAPTPATADDTTKIATTAYVKANLTSYLTSANAASSYLTIANASATYLTQASATSTYAPLASPALTGTPTAPTAAALTSTTQVATTAFVQGERAPRIQSVTSSATVTPTFLNDEVTITAQAAGLSLANPTGTAIVGHGIVIRIKDNGTARSISYGSQYRAIGVTLPNTTVISKTLYLGMIWNSTDSKWDVVSVAQEA